MSYVIMQANLDVYLVKPGATTGDAPTWKIVGYPAKGTPWVFNKEPSWWFKFRNNLLGATVVTLGAFESLESTAKIKRELDVLIWDSEAACNKWSVIADELKEGREPSDYDGQHKTHLQALCLSNFFEGKYDAIVDIALKF